jgi:hypothetical protein
MKTSYRQRGYRCFVWIGLAALLYGGPDGDVKTASTRSDARAAFVYSDVTPFGPGASLAFADEGLVFRGIRTGHAGVAFDDAKLNSLNASDECLLTEDCIDRYLWSIYQRTRKVDTIKVPERKSVTVNRKGKTRTVTRTVIKLVDEDFTWKDPKAAEKVGMSVAEYVIGGMDRSFKVKLYHLFRALDDAGLAPGMTSGFRDDYRQLIASGNKAATDRSYHGGTRRGGYGRGLAADVVSVKGETRSERWISTENLWKWIDAHGKQFGIGRPYLDRDPPHIGPIDGKEYADRRGLNAKRAAL